MMEDAVVVVVVVAKVPAVRPNLKLELTFSLRSYTSSPFDAEGCTLMGESVAYPCARSRASSLLITCTSRPVV